MNLRHPFRNGLNDALQSLQKVTKEIDPAMLNTVTRKQREAIIRPLKGSVINSLDTFIKADREWTGLRLCLSEMEQAFAVITHAHSKGDGIEETSWKRFLEAVQRIQASRIQMRKIIF